MVSKDFKAMKYVRSFQIWIVMCIDDNNNLNIYLHWLEVVGPKNASVSLVTMLLIHSLNIISLLDHVEALLLIIPISLLYRCNSLRALDSVNADV